MSEPDYIVLVRDRYGEECFVWAANVTDEELL